MFVGVANLIAWVAIYASNVEHIKLLISQKGSGTSLLHTGCLAHDPAHRHGGHVPFHLCAIIAGYALPVLHSVTCVS